MRCKRCGKVVLEWAFGEHKREPCRGFSLNLGSRLMFVANEGICAHVLDGAPLTNKKTIKAKEDPSKKRRASEGDSRSCLHTSFNLFLPLPIHYHPAISPINHHRHVAKKANVVSESTSASPTKKRRKPLSDDEPDLPSTILDVHSYKGLKKSDIKKIQKERLRVEKREAKARERDEIAERKRQRGGSGRRFRLRFHSDCCPRSQHNVSPSWSRLLALTR